MTAAHLNDVDGINPNKGYTTHYAPNGRQSSLSLEQRQDVRVHMLMINTLDLLR
jgi:hypothetical protein